MKNNVTLVMLELQIVSVVIFFIWHCHINKYLHHDYSTSRFYWL